MHAFKQEGANKANEAELEPWNNLKGKVVLVTGASAGLGREFCLNLAGAGCRIVAAARRLGRLKSLCDEINRSYSSSGGELAAVAVELDVAADARAIEGSVRKAWDAFGRIDALVNNAGMRGKISSSLDLSEEDWNTTIRTNLTGAWLVSKYVGRHMRDAGQGGSIVNISSISGLNRAQMRGGVAYSSSKAAMDSMTRIMALELGELKIRVNAIAPGLFRSEITEGLLNKEWIHEVAKKTVPLRTLGTSDPALTSLLRFLVHESANYVTGNLFIVDAGYSLPGVPLFFFPIGNKKVAHFPNAQQIKDVKMEQTSLKPEFKSDLMYAIVLYTFLVFLYCGVYWIIYITNMELLIIFKSFGSKALRKIVFS